MRSYFASCCMLVCLAFAVTVPFFNYARTIPSADWWTHALALALLGGALFAGLLVVKQDENPRALLWLLGWWLLVFLPAFILRSGNVYQLPLSEAGAVLLVTLGAVQIHGIQHKIGREVVVTVLATSILIAALLQALIGFTQLMGMTSLGHGYLLVDPSSPRSNIMGNFGQRNQFAQFLSWGVIAAAYLSMTGRLRVWLAVPAMVVLSVVMAWSGGRLPLAYAVAMVLVAMVWWWRSGDRKVLFSLLVGAGLIIIAQLFGHYIASWLTGLDVNSGLDRINDAGFGARRRIEWEKVWQIVQAYPWFGVGFSGFAYQSVWLEAFAGLGKIPENALFTHSHNLVTQLLAETGIPATLLAAIGVAACLLPYWRRDQATPENAFLILIAAALLGHSMFEYPLWYLPFLAMFFVVLSLSPQTGVSIPVRPALRRVGTLLLLVGTVFYVVSGAKAFTFLQTSVFPGGNAQTNQKNIDGLVALSPNLFWSYEAELGLSNYLQPSHHDLEFKRRHYEQLVAYRPYPLLLCHLAMLRSWSGDQNGARDAMLMALATFPKDGPQLLWRLRAANDPSLQPLITLAQISVTAREQGGDLAAVEAITKGLPVRGPQIPDLSRFR